MFDALPPPAFHEPAPAGYGRTASGLLVPEQAFGVIPQITPSGLGFTGTKGKSIVPPIDPPSGSNATFNVSNTNPTNSLTNSAYAGNSAVVVWHTLRSNIQNDTGTPSVTITDNQGGTYTALGAFQGPTSNAATATWWCRAYKRDQPITPAGYAAGVMVLTATGSLAGSAGSLSHAGYVMEIKNPGGLTAHVEQHAANQIGVAGSNTMTNTADPWCIDFQTGGATTSTASALSGMTQIASSATFIGSTARCTAWVSGNQAMAANRTYTCGLHGQAVSIAVWFDGPARSRAKLGWSPTDARDGTAYNTTESWTGVAIGTPAPDRQVVIVAGGYMNSAGTNFTLNGITTSITPTIGGVLGGAGDNGWERLWTAASAPSEIPSAIFWGVVPTGTTMNVTLTSSNSAWKTLVVYVLYGAKTLFVNDLGTLTSASGGVAERYTAGTATTPLQWTDVVRCKGTLMIGPGCSRPLVNNPSAGAIWGKSALQPSTTGFGFYVHDAIAASADTTAQVIGIAYSGNAPVSLGYGVFGP